MINDLSYDQRMIRICRTLSVHDYDVLLVGRTLKKSIPLREELFRQRRLKCFFRRGPLFYAEFNLRLLAFLWKENPDIIYNCDLDTIIAGAMVARLRGNKRIFDSHELFEDVPELKDRKIIRAVWSWIGKVFAPGADSCITVNNSIATILQNKYEKNFHVIRNLPVIWSGEILPLKKRKSILIYQGALNAGRGLPEAILAMHALTNYELHLIGDGDLGEDLGQIVRGEKLEHKVKFIGKLSPDKLRDYSTHAVLGLNLLDDTSSNYYYSLANKFFDYMQAGVPSVNMAFPEYQDILNKWDVGYTIPDLDPEKIASALNAILSDSQALSQKIENTRRAREIFNWASEEKTLLNIFAGL